MSIVKQIKDKHQLTFLRKLENEFFNVEKWQLYQNTEKGNEQAGRDQSCNQKKLNKILTELYKKDGFKYTDKSN